MELLEAIGWVTVGFVPTLIALEIAYLIATKKKVVLALGGHKKNPGVMK